MTDYLDTIDVHSLLSEIWSDYEIETADAFAEFGEGIGDFAFDQFVNQEGL